MGDVKLQENYVLNKEIVSTYYSVQKVQNFVLMTHLSNEPLYLYPAIHPGSIRIESWGKLKKAK